MIDKNNFMGLSGFVWWVGVVEDINDPLAAGRCKVRVIGWHTDNKSLLPTEDLPWAAPVYPINASNHYSPCSEEDWVLGFFMDGENAQFPYMLGVLPYIRDQQKTS